MIYKSLLINSNNFDIYLRLLQEIEKYEENNKINSKIINLFSQFLLKENTQESFHLLNYMINYNLLESKIIQNINKPFFVHINQDKFYEYKYLFDKENISYEELSKNDFALHKQLVKEGVNPDEIAKIIRNDEIEKLQEISSQTNFDFNQTIRKSLYERCDFVNKINVSLIDYAAFFSSNKCFKYLLMNSTKVNNTGKYAVAGGNLEIIHLCEQNHSSFENAYETAIVFHRNEIFKYLYENKIEKIDNLEKLGTKCIYYHNYEIFTFLEEKGMRIDNSIIIESAKIGNLFLTKYFLKKYQIPNELIVFSVESGNIEFVRYLFSKKHININAQNDYEETALIKASIKGYLEIVELLLEQKGININAKNRYGDTALILASLNGYTEIVKLLLEQEGIDINAKDKWGYTALHIAVRNNNIEIVKLLIEQKRIYVNSKDDNGKTALILSLEKGHIEIVKLLLEQEGIEINAKDTYLFYLKFIFQNNIWKLFKLFNTALIWASYYGHTEIVKLLLEQEGIDINAKNNNGWTALMYASSKGHTEIVELLLEQEEIDINAKNK